MDDVRALAFRNHFARLQVSPVFFGFPNGVARRMFKLLGIFEKEDLPLFSSPT